MSDAVRERGQSPDSQETISDNNLSPEIDEKEISKNLPLDELQRSKGFSGNLDLLDSKCYLESSESDCHSSDSDYISSPTSYDYNPQAEKGENCRERFQFQTILVELRRIWNGRTDVIYVPNLFQGLQFQKIL